MTTDFSLKTMYAVKTLLRGKNTPAEELIKPDRETDISTNKARHGGVHL
jgi:hypothetical protein